MTLQEALQDPEVEPVAHAERRRRSRPLDRRAAPVVRTPMVHLLVTYSIRDGQQEIFLGMWGELRALMRADDVTLLQDRGRPNLFVEMFHFDDEASFRAFDERFVADQRAAEVYRRLDMVVQRQHSDYRLLDRRL